MKKLFAIVLACVMILSCFAGCGAGNTNTETQAPATQPAKAETPSEKTPGEIVNISVHQRGADGNPAEAEVIAAMNEYSAEKIGVTITFTATPAAEFAETLSRKIAAKDDLDVTFVASYTGFNELVAKNGLMDITDMLQEEQFSELRNLLPEDIWAASAVNGRSYCVPNYKETPYAMTLLTPAALANTIKEKYGIDFNAIEVETFRDLYKLEDYLLAAQKEGVKYPALTSEVDMALSSLLTSDTEYELIGSDIFSPYVVNKKTHEVSNIFNNPDFDVWFEEMKRWNELGLWSEDNIPLDWDPRAYVSSVDYAVYPAAAVPDNATQQSNTWGYEIYSKNITPATILSRGTLGSTWAITAHSKKAEAAMKWIQLVETDQTYADMFIYGIEGKHYTRDSEEVITKIADSGWNNATWKTTCFETPSIMSSQSSDLKQQYRDFNAAGTLGVLASFTPNYDKIESEWAAVKAIFMEEYHLYTLGFYSTENLADSAARYKAAGDDVIIAELQRRVDEYLAK